MGEIKTAALLLFITALAVTLFAVPLASKIAWRVGSVDYPSRRRVNTKPTPRMGGIAVMLGMAVSFLVWVLAAPSLGLPSAIQVLSSNGVNPLGVAVAIAAMFTVGVVDDAIQLTALNKFFWQIVAACIAVASGVVIGEIASPLSGGYFGLGIFAYPLTVIFLVSFANIINLIDGVDGLASGITAVCSAALFALSVLTFRFETAALAAALFGATLGFLRWNFNPAKIFLGDSGSLLLGFSLGLAVILLNTGHTTLSMILAPIVMVGVPILDTFAAIVRRSRVGVSIGTPDKGHIHHRLLKRGFGQKALVAIIYAITALLCVFAFIITQVPLIWKLLIFVVLAALAILLGVYLQMFVPVVRRRFDPETGENEVVPINEVDESEDYTKDEIASALVGAVDADKVSAGPSFKSEHPLRVLAVSQHYWPEPFAIADVCEGLAAMGHEVTVLTGTPNYPDGDIYPGYERGARGSQERNGVHIRRVEIIPRGREIWQRVINYYSFSSRATKEALRMNAEYDVVLSFQTSPVMMARPALAYGEKHNVPVLLWCQDLWPESLTVGNIKRTSLIFKGYARVSRKIYNAATVLAVTSRNFSDYFKSVLKMNRDTVYLPQYAEDIFNEEAPKRSEYDSAKVNLTFAGNVGIAQAVNTFVEAGHYLEGDPRFALHVVGSGSELETLKKYKSEIGASCVEFHGRHPLAEMPSFYGSSDAMVATFANNSILGYTLPRKVTSYMAAGRPILGTVTGEARHVIEEAGCGLCCDPEDPEGLASICRQFADMTPSQREEMGRRGRRYYEEHFAKDSFYTILEKELQTMKDGKNE